MPAIGNDMQFRVRDQAVHLSGLLNGDAIVFFPPADKNRHFEGWQDVIGDVTAREHGVQCAPDYPIPRFAGAQNIARQEARQGPGIGFHDGLEKSKLLG